ncbi:hypothetical protein HMPREF0083_03118 [Aneurinibacillus aneurinilyticus ATCC 12856]|uniref:Uncharacterized protein n=1 Tax=Aneurinibacillus aneurinilyticus ATCC 12856 TaxID=649747 RepID=U1YDJ4_ANEAE|nr:hypothetical protein HMPREF0083_03118 [Aneurinibacillus aneurinilyticus ATCC 12856]
MALRPYLSKGLLLTKLMKGTPEEKSISSYIRNIGVLVDFFSSKLCHLK